MQSTIETASFAMRHDDVEFAAIAANELHLLVDPSFASDASTLV